MKLDWYRVGEQEVQVILCEQCRERIAALQVFVSDAQDAARLTLTTDSAILRGDRSCYFCEGIHFDESEEP